MFCQELPGIEWFTNDNPYTESYDLLHYIILPDVKEELLVVKFWIGEFCYEKSLDIISEERSFPLTKSGRSDMIEYIRQTEFQYNNK